MSILSTFAFLKFPVYCSLKLGCVPKRQLTVCLGHLLTFLFHYVMWTYSYFTAQSILALNKARFPVLTAQTTMHKKIFKSMNMPAEQL